MFSRLEWMIAGRYLRARRKEGAISAIAWFSLIGILLGVGTLIVVMAVMNGFRTELVGRIVGAQPHVLVLGPAKEGVRDYDVLSEKLRAVPGVTRAAPRMEQTVMGSSAGGLATGVLVRGLRKEDLLSLPGVADPEDAVGSLDNYENGIAVADGVAQTLGLIVGDKITLITPPNRDLAFGRAPTRRTYSVEYIFRIGMHQYDKVFVFLPLKEAQGLLNRRGQVDGIEINVEDPDLVSPRNIDEVSIGLASQIGPGNFLWNWKRANGAFIAALDTERVVMRLLLSLIIVVAALNIISGLIMLVKEKGQNIGIMRTFGMSRGSILRIFFICGASIGVIGTVLGVIAGMLFVIYIHEIQSLVEALSGASVWDPEIRYLTRIPAVLKTSDVVIAMGIGLGLSFVATWYPARRAARLDPVEALRYE
ncbi:MAG: lipoprotein-releasing ABC transporter permease subunit [Pseudomonadota bacterium]